MNQETYFKSLASSRTGNDFIGADVSSINGKTQMKPSTRKAGEEELEEVDTQ